MSTGIILFDIWLVLVIFLLGIMVGIKVYGDVPRPKIRRKFIFRKKDRTFEENWGEKFKAIDQHKVPEKLIEELKKTQIDRDIWKTIAKEQRKEISALKDFKDFQQKQSEEK